MSRAAEHAPSLHAATVQVEQCPFVRVGSYKNLVVIRWSGRPDSFESIDLIEQAFARAHAYSGRRIGVLAIIETDAALGLPHMTYRTALGRLGRAWKGRIAERAVVYGATDWKASLIRSLITHLDSLWSAQPSGGKRVFEQVNDAAAWLSRVMPRTAQVDAGEILALADAVLGQVADELAEPDRTSGIWARGAASTRPSQARG